MTVEAGQVSGVHTRYADLDPMAEDAVTQFVLAALCEIPATSKLVIVPTDTLTPDGCAQLADALTSLATVVDATVAGTTAAAPVRVRAPRSAPERAVLSFASRNARNALEMGRVRRPQDPDEVTAALDHLLDALSMSTTPRRIECFDISHTQGRHPVASIVVAVNGVVQPREYRRVNIPTDLGGDDFASIAHAMRRRLTGTRCGLDSLPDLFLIDGGPLQVAAAEEVVAELFAGSDWRPATVGLAKRLEELWLPGDPDPVVLPRTARSLQIVQTLRDEAHRWAITGHRRQRDKAALRVVLDDIDGVGPSRRRALLERFETMDAVAKASVSELATVPGVGPALAQRIHDTYRSI